jgi:hypothetical protein
VSALLLAIACASCGSGGDSPLVLYPNEAYKVYVGQAFQADLRSLTPDGGEAVDLGPRRRDITTVAAGASFLTDWFATLTAPYVTNARDGRTRSGLGDVLASVTWTVAPASLLAPAVPQVQVTAAYKRAEGKSPYETEDANALDVFGNGFDEARAGVDLWWGASAWKAGGNVTVLVPRERRYEEHTLGGARGARVTLTGGYGFGEAGKVIGGCVLERRGRKTDGGRPLAHSDEAANGVFAGGDAMIGERQAVRLTLARAAAFGANRNGVRSDAITVAWMGSL